MDDVNKHSGDAKDSNQNLFSGNNDPLSSSRDGGAANFSQEDQEAMPDDLDNSHDNKAQHPNNDSIDNAKLEDRKINKDGIKDVNEDVSKLDSDEEHKMGISKTERKNSQNGVPAIVYETGRLDSHHSSARDKIIHNGKSLNSKHDSKDDVWNEDSKINANEDEKHAEEVSLLDPANEGNPYKNGSKDCQEEDKDMRRSSTKPDRPVISRDQSKNSKSDEKKEEGEGEEDDEEKPKVQTE
jgi:hypothetical protein